MISIFTHFEPETPGLVADYLQSQKMPCQEHADRQVLLSQSQDRFRSIRLRAENFLSAFFENVRS